MEIEMIEKEIDILPETIKRTFQLRNNHLPGNLKLIIIKDRNDFIDITD